MQLSSRGRYLAPFILAGALICSFADKLDLSKPYRQWTLDESIRLLTESPWARQHTFTRVIGGIGSGAQGEKEIYTSFFVRFLSAAPVREALARIQQIQQGYDDMPDPERRDVDKQLAEGLKMDVSRWIVVSVSFRSNHRDSEQSIRRFLQTQTVETYKNRSYLITDHFARVDLVAYFPPRGDGVGAKFVFPRTIEGEPVITAGDREVTFVADIPGPTVRVTFPVPPMVVDGELIL